MCCAAFLAVTASSHAEDKVPVSATVSVNQEFVGKTAPGFTLKNQDGEDVSLSQYKGKKNVLLIFSRAAW